MLQYVGRLNDLDTSHTNSQKSYIFPSRGIDIGNSCGNNSNDCSGQGDFPVKTGRIFMLKIN
jgi:hypothetical protein